MRFEFSAPQRIVFGCGSSAEIPGYARAMGSRCLFVTGATPSRTRSLAESIEHAGMPTTQYGVCGEPTTSTVSDGLEAARTNACDLVVAAVGGSVIDAGKAIAAMMTNQGALLDHLEVVGRGLPLANRAAPLIAVPTTAGTGSEATRNAVIISERHGVKASLRSHALLPALVLVDPALCLTLPPPLTAGTGLDALTQLIEAFTTRSAGPLTDRLCMEGLTRAAASLRKAFHEGHNLEARTDMSLAALLSGMALANAGLGAVHGIAAALGGLGGAPHGFVCAALLPHVLDANIRGLMKDSPSSLFLARYARAASILTGRASARAEDIVGWTEELCMELGTPTLGEMGILPDAQLSLIAQNALRASSMKGNPVALSLTEVLEILRKAL